MNDRHLRKATNAGTEPGLQPDSNGKHFCRDVLGATEKENTEDTEDIEEGGPDLGAEPFLFSTRLCVLCVLCVFLSGSS